MTAAHLVVLVLLGWWLFQLYEGGYLSAWFASFVVALVALMSLSVPRSLVVTDNTLEVRCLLDITEIELSEIASVRRVEPRQLRWFVPLMGVYGFFGYYGYYFDIRRMERVKFYASEWRNMVEIVDIYDDRLYISCRDADALVAQLTPAGGNRLDDDAFDEE